VQYAPDKSAFVWKIKQLAGGRDFLMRAHFGLPSVKSGACAPVAHAVIVPFIIILGPENDSMDRRPPITVKFEIPYFTVSGIQVRYLKIVDKSGYQALPWVRYITQNGDDYRCVAGFSLSFGSWLHANARTAHSLRTALEKGAASIVPM
jgi:AP-1 complex subunit mu